MPVVGDEDAELDVAEIAGARHTIARWLALTVAQPVMAGEVENAAGARLLMYGIAFGAHPVGNGSVASRSIDHDIGAQFANGAVALDLQAFGNQPAAFASRDETAHTGIGHEGDAGKLRGVAAQDEFERGAAAEEKLAILVARRRHIVFRQRQRQTVFETEEPCAFGQEFGHEIGIALADKRGEAAQKGVAVAKLRRALAFPIVESVFRRTLWRRRIAIEDRHLAAAVAERQRRA